MIFRRRFSALIRRQLDVFAADEREGLLAEVDEMKRKYDAADRREAEEAYGDYVDVVEAVTEALADMRDRYKRTLDGEVGEAYDEAFNRAVKKRWPAFGLEIELR